MCTTQILVTWEDKVPQENDIFLSGAALKNIFKKGGGGGYPYISLVPCNEYILLQLKHIPLSITLYHHPYPQLHL